jgi:DNA polymerase III delta prime subunit
MDAKKESGSQVIRERENFHKEISEKENRIKNDILMQLKSNTFSADKQDYKVLRNGEAKKEIERLEIENIYLRQLIADMKTENSKLRRSLGDYADLHLKTKSNLK